MLIIYIILSLAVQKENYAQKDREKLVKVARFSEVEMKSAVWTVSPLFSQLVVYFLYGTIQLFMWKGELKDIAFYF